MAPEVFDNLMNREYLAMTKYLCSKEAQLIECPTNLTTQQYG